MAYDGDEITVGEKVTVTIYQSAGLVKQTRTLSEITKRQSANIDIVALSTATILMAAAALEAIISETAFILNPSLYNQKKFRKAGVSEKFKLLKGYSSGMLDELWEARNAVAHAEPDHRRTKFVGEKLNIRGAEWAATCVEDLSKEVWGKEMPEWFANETGLKNEP